jgi:phosphatidylserine/phosphatidylglycerophosphate/cardiolipin synthase-like enzyme
VGATLLDRFDATLGDGIERALMSHHVRRLRRRGRLDALIPTSEGLWARTAGAPLRSGNSLEVLIDGANALPAMVDAMRRATRSVHICSWHLQPDFLVERGDRHPLTIRNLLADLAERVHVRVLQWAGAPLPVFSPRRDQVKRAREELVRGTRIRAHLDACTRLMHCHHEKVLIVDGELAFVGGIDFTALAGDRYDFPGHPVQSMGWHDATARLRGPIVRDVQAHFALRWGAVTGEALELPEPEPAGDVEAQFVRTVPETAYRVLHHGEFSVLEAYMRALRSARRLIYLENQFLWSPEIVDVLEGKLRNPPADDFRLVVLLPQRANNGQDDTKGMLGRLVEADDGAGRFLGATIQSRTGDRSGPLYVHAKIGVVDDHWLAIGSANLNEHSLFNDTEVDVITCDPLLARDTRLRLWAEHLERAREEVDDEPARVIDELWRPIASEQLARRRAGLPMTHHLLELPGVSRRAGRLLGPVNALVVDA